VTAHMSDTSNNTTDSRALFSIPQKIKDMLGDAIKRFDMFNSVLDLVSKNGGNVGKLPERVAAFKKAGTELLEEINNLPTAK
jgi:hypothetical protein